MTPQVSAGFLLAAGAGATARYLLGEFVQSRWPGAFPWGTVVVNVSGCLLLGFLTGFALVYDVGDAATIIGSGMLGAYTTFSTFTVETVRLVEEGLGREALVNIGVNLVVGVAAAMLGLGLAAAVN